MTINQSDLDSFHHFATNELAHGGPELNLEELISRWQAERDHAETVASIRRGITDADSGRVHDLDDVDTKIRSELGFSARS